MGSEIEMKSKINANIGNILEKIDSIPEYKFYNDFDLLYKQDVYYSLNGKKPNDISEAVRLRKEGDLGAYDIGLTAADNFLDKLVNAKKEDIDKNIRNTTYSLTMKEKINDGFVEKNKEYETTFKKPEIIHRLLEKVGYKQYLNKIKKSLGCYVVVNNEIYLHLEFVEVIINDKSSGIYLETEVTFEDDVTDNQYEKIKNCIETLYKNLDMTKTLDDRSWPTILGC